VILLLDALVVMYTHAEDLQTIQRIDYAQKFVYRYFVTHRELVIGSSDLDVVAICDFLHAWSMVSESPSDKLTQEPAPIGHFRRLCNVIAVMFGVPLNHTHEVRVLVTIIHMHTAFGVFAKRPPFRRYWFPEGRTALALFEERPTTLPFFTSLGCESRVNNRVTHAKLEKKLVGRNERVDTAKRAAIEEAEHANKPLGRQPNVVPMLISATIAVVLVIAALQAILAPILGIKLN
jgi:hypothetical protein